MENTQKTRELQQKAKRHLEEVALLENKIESKTELLDILNNEKMKVTVELKEKVQTSGKSDFGDIVDKVIDLEKEINDEKVKMTNKKLEIINNINKLDDGIYISLLVNRYVYLYNLSETAIEMGCSFSQIKKLQRLALVELGKILEDDCKKGKVNRE